MTRGMVTALCDDVAGSVLAELCFGGGNAAGLGIALLGITLFHGNLVVGIKLVRRSVFLGLTDLFAHLGVCQCLGLGSLGFLDTNVLVIARLVVALFLGDCIGRLGLGL